MRETGVLEELVVGFGASICSAVRASDTLYMLGGTLLEYAMSRTYDLDFSAGIDIHHKPVVVLIAMHLDRLLYEPS